jgi:plasmid maintenance system killer protein
MQIICSHNLKQLLFIEGDGQFPKGVVKSFQMTYDVLEGLHNSKEMYQYKGRRVHKLKGNKQGLLAIYLNRKWRLEFRMLSE